MVNRGVRWQLTAAYTATTSAATILNTSRPRMDLTDELTFGRVPKFTFTTIHATVARCCSYRCESFLGGDNLFSERVFFL